MDDEGEINCPSAAYWTGIDLIMRGASYVNWETIGRASRIVRKMPAGFAPSIPGMKDFRVISFAGGVVVIISISLSTRERHSAIESTNISYRWKILNLTENKHRIQQCNM